MNSRQKELLKYIIDEHIKTAEPVGSNFLVNKHFQDISSATIRNEMVELEKQGFIAQPHTSAGRIPTEAGYKFYLENFVENGEVKEFQEFKNLDDLKDIAKKIAEISNAAAILGFSKDNVYYTGISNVFSQPEFHRYDLAYNFSAVIDHLDEVVSKIYGQITSEIQVKIGKENPFGEDCSLIVTKNRNKMLGIIGPIRMDYQKNISLLKYVKKLI